MRRIRPNNGLSLHAGSIALVTCQEHDQATLVVTAFMQLDVFQKAYSAGQTVARLTHRLKSDDISTQEKEFLERQVKQYETWATQCVATLRNKIQECQEKERQLAAHRKSVMG